MFSQYTTGIKTEEFLLLLRMKQYVTRSKISYCKFWHRRQILTFSDVCLLQASEALL